MLWKFQPLFRLVFLYFFLCSSYWHISGDCSLLRAKKKRKKTLSRTYYWEYPCLPYLEFARSWFDYNHFCLHWNQFACMCCADVLLEIETLYMTNGKWMPEPFGKTNKMHWRKTLLSSDSQLLWCFFYHLDASDLLYSPDKCVGTYWLLLCKSVWSVIRA